MVVNKQEVEIKKISHWRHDDWLSGYHGWVAIGLAAETGSMKIIIMWILHLERSVFLLTNPL